MKPTVWASDVMLIDVESGNQIGECWIVEVPIAQARTVADAASLRRSVAREIVVMTLVILLGGLLAYVPPPGEGEMDVSTHQTTS